MGTGSGLAIAKHAVQDIHGGKITLKSTPLTKGSGLSRRTVKDIKDVLHETVFIIHLNRKTLNDLSGSAFIKDKDDGKN